jgi:hypothetical protein
VTKVTLLSRFLDDIFYIVQAEDAERDSAGDFGTPLNPDPGLVSGSCEGGIGWEQSLWPFLFRWLRLSFTSI